MGRTIRGLLAVVAAGLGGVAAVDDKPGDKAKADPPGTPLTLTVTGKTEYTLDTGGQTPAAYKKKIEEAVKAGGPLPATPTVELTAEVKNTSDRPVTVWVKGDPVVLELELKGEGAVNATPPLAFTQEFRIPEGVQLAPGKSFTFPVKSLTSGFRGASRFSYWTAPGEYKLVATLKTGVQPAPKGAKDFDGFGIVTLTSAPVTTTVTEKK